MDFARSNCLVVLHNYIDLTITAELCCISQYVEKDLLVSISIEIHFLVILDVRTEFYWDWSILKLFLGLDSVDNLSGRRLDALLDDSRVELFL